MGNIITFTGSSGAGKSTIAQALGFPFVLSTTTRMPRASDLPGEYEYIEIDDQVWEEKGWNAYLWIEPHAGNYYGTKREVVDRALQDPGISMMILIPKVLPKLLDYTGTENVLPFYIRSPEEKILRARMQQRGEIDNSIELRLNESRKWDEQAETSGIPYIFLTNNGTIEEAVEQVRGYLK